MRAAATATLRTLPRVAAVLPPRLKRGLLIALAAAVLLTSLYHLWFRDSSFARVEKVTIFGLSTSDAPRIRNALEAAARDQSTLNVSVADLEQAVASYPIVHSLSVTPDFPHRLTIDVVEHRPVLALVVGSRRVAVSASGTLLPGVAATSGLPVIRINGALPQREITDLATLQLVRVLGAAPDALRRRLLDARQRKGKGIVVRVRQGPDLIFGNAHRAAAKWAAAARVLADPKAAGASYVDVRLPERPAAGGLPVETIAPVAAAGTKPAAPAGTPGAAVPDTSVTPGATVAPPAPTTTAPAPVQPAPAATEAAPQPPAAAPPSNPQP